MVFIGCEDDKASESDSVNPLVGVWEMTSASILIQSNPSQTITINADANNSETMVLGEDGTYSFSGKIDGVSESGSGSWSSTGSKLTIMEDGEDTIIVDFSISGSTLTTSLTEPETDTNYGTVITVIYEKT
tara:strand:+ start:30 stop:422 length:393 start_codon:yes stop_codon:yes gene_type:complete